MQTRNCCASFYIYISFRPLVHIFLMNFQLSREQFRTMISYDWKIGLSYKDSHVRLVQAWGDQASSESTVLNWFHEFQRENFIVEDRACSGRPRTAVNQTNIDAVRTIIENDPHSTCDQIEDTQSIISSGSIQLFIMV